MRSDFVQTILSNVALLQGNTIENDERVSFGAIETTDVSSNVESVDWTDSIIDRCRFQSTTISDSSFERVIGLEAMSEAGVNVLLDPPMWRDLGDYYLRERGMQPIEGSAAALHDDLLDEVIADLDQRRS